MDATTIQELAGELHSQFTQDTRTNGDKFWKCEGSSEEGTLARHVIYAAHDNGDIFPDDVRYEMIYEALGAIEDAEDPDEIEIDADPYTQQLTAWLHSSVSRVYYLSEALEEYEPKDGFQALALAQLREKEEVLSQVRAALESWEGESDDDS